MLLVVKHLDLNNRHEGCGGDVVVNVMGPRCLKCGDKLPVERMPEFGEPTGRSPLCLTERMNLTYAAEHWCADHHLPFNPFNAISAVLGMGLGLDVLPKLSSTFSTHSRPEEGSAGDRLG